MRATLPNLRSLSITFLGTCSGGGPTPTRACTATSINFEHTNWLVDCAEGTARQMQRTHDPAVRATDTRKIFCTHLHADHVLGIVGVMKKAMPSHSRAMEYPPLQDLIRMELYGPAGLRALVRTNLTLMHVNLMGKYAVHELLRREDQPTSCQSSDMHGNEVAGADILPEAGVWTGIAEDEGFAVDAAPLQHRVPCVGYVFRELEDPDHFAYDVPLDLHTRLHYPCFPRKIAILGDTCDPSPIAALAQGADVLVHEATYSTIPPELRTPRAGAPPSGIKALFPGPRQVRGLRDMQSLEAWEASLLRLHARHLEAKKDETGDGEASIRTSSSTRSATVTAMEPPERSTSVRSTAEAEPGEGPKEEEVWYGSESWRPTLEQLKGDETEVFAVSQGHSTAVMAGAFAQKIRAKGLYLNHIGTRYPDAGKTLRPSQRQGSHWMVVHWKHLARRAVIDEIERQATLAWADDSGAQAVVAKDLTTVDVHCVSKNPIPIHGRYAPGEGPRRVISLEQNGQIVEIRLGDWGSDESQSPKEMITEAMEETTTEKTTEDGMSRSITEARASGLR